MRRFPFVTVMVLLVGVVLSLSLWTMRRAGREAVGEFRGARAQEANEAGTTLAALLGSFERDTRLLATLAERTRRQGIAPAEQDQAILTAFQALAIVVPHYRTLLLAGAGRPSIVAVDPTEDTQRIAPQLLEASAVVAREVSSGGASTTLRGPLSLAGGKRLFYVRAMALPDGEAVVMTVDAAMVLELVSRNASGHHVLAVIDPGGSSWLGCQRREQCRLLPEGDQSRALREVIDDGRRTEEVVAPASLARDLPRRVVVGTGAPVSSPFGRWEVAVLASVEDIDVRQRAFLWQLVWTSFGVAGAMLTVGLFLVRQHSRAAALGVRLQAAEDLAAERARSDEQLYQLQRQLVRAEKLVTVGVLSAGIAHEVGTPLAVIRGRAEHLLEGLAEGRIADDLGAMVGEIDRISSTIHQVLDFSREQPVELGPSDARAGVAKALDLLQWRLASKRIAASVTGPDALPAIAADPGLFEQVMVNLILNACDASPIDGRVEIALGPDSARRDRLRIEVVDHGVGIPAANLDAVFDPYFTTKPRGEGTGLGLAVVAQIIRSHRGEIALRSVVDAGTTVTILWPLAEESPLAV